MTISELPALKLELDARVQELIPEAPISSSLLRKGNDLVYTIKYEKDIS